MAYSPSTLENVYSMMDGAWNIFRYISTDSIGTVLGAGYITDYKSHHMQVGDLVFVVNQSTPLLTVCKVNSVSSTAGTATLTVADTAGTAGSFTNLTATGNVSLGTNASSLFGMYGATAVSQRASAVQASSNISASTFATIGSNLAAFLTEVANTFQGLGAWKGAA